MGNKYSEQNPPPFHVNVNNSPYLNPNENYQNYLSKTNQNEKEINNNNNTNLKKSVLVNEDQNPYKSKTESDSNNNLGDSQNFDKLIEEQGKNNTNNNIIKKKEINRYEEEENTDFSIDIDVVNKNKVNVRIPVNKKNTWQKEYYNNELIGTIINDYINENRLNLPDDFFNELRCFNYKVSMEDQISTLLPMDDESKNIYQGSDINSKNIDLSHLNDQYTEIMGKPFFEPFEILCFYKSQRKFRMLRYNKNLVNKTEIANFNKTSAFCNGWNHLYISGGEGCSDKFWDINLKKNLIHDPIQIPPKKCHSMIYIPKKIVFIVGGNNSDTYYYNLKEKKLVNWGKLNMIRIEPALQIVKNKLYCIDSIKNLNTFSFEMTDLTANKGKWKIIMPKITYNITNNMVHYQQLFGICKDKDDNIIFLGGKFNDNTNDQNTMNFMLNTLNNTLGLSKVKFIPFNLKEKCFCPFNKLYDFVLTDFDREAPQMVFYNKKKGKLELINFSPDDISKKSEVETNSGINQQNNINNKTTENTSNISQNINNINNNQYINNNNNNNYNNNNGNNGIFVSFKPKETTLNTYGNISQVQPQPQSIVNNQNKAINLVPITGYKTNNNTNIINNNNNYIRKNTPHFLDYNVNNKNSILLKPVVNMDLLNKRNTVCIFQNKTPDKYIYSTNYQTVTNQNYLGSNYVSNYRESSHSADTARRKYYYPRIGINKKINYEYK